MEGGEFVFALAMALEIAFRKDLNIFIGYWGEDINWKGVGIKRCFCFIYFLKRMRKLK